MDCQYKRGTYRMALLWLQQYGVNIFRKQKISNRVLVASDFCVSSYVYLFVDRRRKWWQEGGVKNAGACLEQICDRRFARSVAVTVRRVVVARSCTDAARPEQNLRKMIKRRWIRVYHDADVKLDLLFKPLQSSEL